MHLVNQIKEANAQSYFLILQVIRQQVVSPAQIFCMPVNEKKVAC